MRDPGARAACARACRGHRRGRGVTLVEFALVAPAGFLLLIGGSILAIVVGNQVNITNATRDVARTAAICGSDTGASSTTSMPSGTGLCTTSNIDTYVRQRLGQITVCQSSAPSCGSVSIQVVTASGAVVGGAPTGFGSNLLSQCQISGPDYVQVKSVYFQPLWAPVLLNVFQSGAGPSGTRELDAVSEAPCEQ